MDVRHARKLVCLHHEVSALALQAKSRRQMLYTVRCVHGEVLRVLDVPYYHFIDRSEICLY